MKAGSERWLFTCEHGGRTVPEGYAQLFAGADDVLASHRGWDAGALDACDALAPALADAVFTLEITRLFIDANRSLTHPRLFSEYTRPLPAPEKDAIIAGWWRPWRADVAKQAAHWIAAGHRVLHVSIHSFTPELDGQWRNADIGLLYDPARAAEREFCGRWQSSLQLRGWRVRRNYPYRGTSDGHTAALRKEFGPRYAGIELELNQALLPARTAALHEALASTLAQLR
ncbi:N-formylglutamate amidohydrolase [Wenzhouxiangella sp. XN24]|uniref:N-formylglutamate amidohydrolase n=1 Tax=Wenzhouxiangella sp. XN24 TaxID=2713569 RepID=UPI0013EA8815|nr:N-formylglutamate amidohydrolase [Wenzhouxiangella sp. XN24]NGX15291.1 N-formylglutamate amidohydrolase [Wenzhouxiangella sp. XN24]